MDLFFTIVILFIIVVAIIYIKRNNRNPNDENVVVAKYEFSVEENEIDSNEERFEGTLERLPLEVHVEDESRKPKVVEVIIDKTLLKIEDELFLDNINTEIKEDEIIWIDNFGTENSVSSYMTATSENRIAWWQCNDVGKDLVRIKLESGIIVNWRPIINTMGMSSLGCSFINFFSEFLIVMYMDKHTDRIFAINTANLNVEEINFYGRYERIKKVENEIFVSKSPLEDILKMTISEDGIKSEIVNLEYLKERDIKFGY